MFKIPCLFFDRQPPPKTECFNYILLFLFILKFPLCELCCCWFFFNEKFPSIDVHCSFNPTSISNSIFKYDPPTSCHQWQIWTITGYMQCMVNFLLHPCYPLKPPIFIVQPCILIFAYKSKTFFFTSVLSLKSLQSLLCIHAYQSLQIKLRIWMALFFINTKFPSIDVKVTHASIFNSLFKYVPPYNRLSNAC